MSDQMKHQRSPGRKLVLALTVILCLQIAASYAVVLGDRPLPAPGLHLIPAQVGNWALTSEDALEPDITAYLRPDDYILRTYKNGNRADSVSLFVAYFKSLQNSYGPHSPRVCLPGSGWLTHSWDIVNMSVPGRPEGVPVNQYVLEKNTQRILVLYWYQNDRRVWAEEFQLKLRLLPDLIRFRRSDVSLVRIVTPVAQGANIEVPLQQATEFARAIFPPLVDRFTHAE